MMGNLKVRGCKSSKVICHEETHICIKVIVIFIYNQLRLQGSPYMGIKRCPTSWSRSQGGVCGFGERGHAGGWSDQAR